MLTFSVERINLRWPGSVGMEMEPSNRFPIDPGAETRLDSPFDSLTLLKRAFQARKWTRGVASMTLWNAGARSLQ